MMPAQQKWRNPGPNWGYTFLLWAARWWPAWFLRRMLMLGTYGLNKESAGRYCLPEEIGGKVTGACYLIVPDCGPVWERAQSAGADVLMPLRTMAYGGQAFTLRDPEGHHWAVGEYDPWTVSTS